MRFDESTGKYKATKFYVKELTAGKGFIISPRIFSVIVKAENISGKPATLNTQDVPELNTVKLILSKYDIDGTPVAEGTGSLEGAEFLIRYYPVDVSVYYTAEQLGKMKAAAAWRIRTKYNEASKLYTAELSKDWLTGSGNSEFYYED